MKRGFSIFSGGIQKGLNLQDAPSKFVIILDAAGSYALLLENGESVIGVYE